VGGGLFSGLRLLVASPFLLALGGQTLLYTATSTFLYFQQARLLEQAAQGASALTALSASIDMWVQLATLALQLGVTGRFMPRFGLGAALAITPLLTAVGFLGLAVLPTLGMLTVIKALRGATHYSFERPGREVLFTRVDREAKYKSKNFIDTVVYRGSDTASSWLEKSLAGLGLGVAGVAAVAVPVAGLWLAVSLWLARRAQAPAVESAVEPALAPDAAR